MRRYRWPGCTSSSAVTSRPNSPRAELRRSRISLTAGHCDPVAAPVGNARHLSTLADAGQWRAPHDGCMSDSHFSSMVRWWAIVVAGAAAALLFAWLGRLAGVPLAMLLAIGAGAGALAWLI